LGVEPFHTLQDTRASVESKRSATPQLGPSPLRPCLADARAYTSTVVASTIIEVERDRQALDAKLRDLQSIHAELLAAARAPFHTPLVIGALTSFAASGSSMMKTQP
jgi:hypothetical protein